MTLRVRKLALIALIGSVILLANAALIVQWLQQIGIVDFAMTLRRQYLTGTALSVIAVLLFLLTEMRGERALLRHCGVCQQRLSRHGRYCPHCGSRA